MTTTGKQNEKFVASEHELYHSYSTEEDKQRTNRHYELPVEFFYLFTGGEWNVYSCNLWASAQRGGVQSDTESQEAKLDLLAQLMKLKPGQRVLDVGCGWGGPLVYLCKTYGVQGVGLTLSSTQKRAAEERVAQHGVDAEIVECHWRDYQDERRFDAVYTDEVIVHFNDLGGFFTKVHSLLRDGGIMLNKELHFTHHSYSHMNRASAFVNEIYGSTGNYRTLAEELAILDEAGFEAQAIHQIPRSDYQKTIDRWLSNMAEHKEAMEALVGTETYRRFRIYLKLASQIVSGPIMTVDSIVAHKLAHS